jgi:hypothetical protein
MTRTWHLLLFDTSSRCMLHCRCFICNRTQTCARFLGTTSLEMTVFRVFSLGGMSSALTRWFGLVSCVEDMEVKARSVMWRCDVWYILIGLKLAWPYQWYGNPTFQVVWPGAFPSRWVKFWNSGTAKLLYVHTFVSTQNFCSGKRTF